MRCSARLGCVGLPSNAGLRADFGCDFWILQDWIGLRDCVSQIGTSRQRLFHHARRFTKRALRAPARARQRGLPLRHDAASAEPPRRMR